MPGRVSSRRRGRTLALAACGVMVSMAAQKPVQTQALAPGDGGQLPPPRIAAPDPGRTTLVSCNSTKGPLHIAVHEGWAPLGAARFLEMVGEPLPHPDGVPTTTAAVTDTCARPGLRVPSHHSNVPHAPCPKGAWAKLATAASTQPAANTNYQAAVAAVANV